MKNVRSALLRALSVVASLAVVATMVAPVAAHPAVAADARAFDPGNIISDAVFFNSGTMTESDIQAFLNAKVPNCASGYTCLKDYREDTRTIGGTPMCRQYDGAWSEPAARIIYKVAQACGINPKALIVILQKEQGLVTDSTPGSRQYRSAMGAGCPDTADCDSNYYGFFNQVHYGAYLLKRYTQPPGTGTGTAYTTRFDRMYPMGQWTNIQYNPNAGCGTKSVFVANQATHALYVYTPYTPNQAALNAGYGIGDSCSAYGNRNFFFYFTDWFGTTQIETRGWIGDKYRAVGGFSSILGYPVANEQTLADGALQAFERGVIYCSASGAYVLRGWIQDRYRALGAERSRLVWPLADEVTLPGGARQQFQGGWLYASSAGTFGVYNEIAAAYEGAGGSSGALGYPIADTQVVPGGAWQSFAGATLHAGPSGQFTTRGWIGDKYASLGGPSSHLGWPVGNERSIAGGAAQDFQNGAILVTSAGAVTSSSAIAAAYETLGGPGGMAGHPTAAAAITPTGSSQTFEKASILASANGAYTVRGWIGDRYAVLGGHGGQLGWPKADEVPVDGGATQAFEGGTILASSAGAFAARGWIGEKYAALGMQQGVLGFPVADEARSGAGWIQNFQRGSIYASSAGTWMLRGWIGDKYRALGAGGSPLGWPKEDEKALPGGASQAFTGGHIYASPAGAFESRGWIGDKYQAAGAHGSALGYPTSDERAVPGGVVQAHQYGSIVSSGAGAFIVRGWIGDRYFALGGPSGRLGAPLGDERLSGSDHVQDFQGGRITVNSRGIFVTYN